MTTPRPPAMTSRLNTGGYRVAVRYARGELEQTDVALHTLINEEFERRIARIPGDLNRTDWDKAVNVCCAMFFERQAAYTADGSLSIEPEEWQVRHYRRAVMRGAGVYQAGLWAMLAGKHAQHDPAQVVEGAALNGAQVLDRFQWRTPPNSLGLNSRPRKLPTIKQGRRNGYKQGARALGLPLGTDTTIDYESYVLLEAALKIDPGDRVSRELFGWGWASNSAYIRCAAAMSEFQKAKLKFLACLLFRTTLTALYAQGDRYRAHLARLVKPQRAPRRAPRPLYSRAIPPAAPLAPPAL